MAYNQNHLVSLKGAKTFLLLIKTKLNSVEGKLETIETGAQVNTVDSVNSKTGSIVLTYSDVGAENVSNKVTSLSSSSTDTQYPSAKCIYDIIGDVESILTHLLEGDQT